MVHGTQTALIVGFVSMGIAAAIGITLGALAGYFGGWVDMLISRIIEVVMCIPSLVLILALVAMLDHATNCHLMVIVGCTGWTGIARLTRAEFLKLKQMEFVTAARAMGAGSARIMFTHILRNALAPVLVPITFGIAAAILIESGLSFLGFGASPPNPSWGTLLVGGPQLDRTNVVADRLPRRRHLPHRPRLQPDRRRPARSHRPPPAAGRPLIIQRMNHEGTTEHEGNIE